MTPHTEPNNPPPLLRYSWFMGAVLAVASCSPSTSAVDRGVIEQTSAPRLPSGIVRTDGKGDVTVIAAGQATCLQTSPEQTAAAMAAANQLRAQRGLAPLRNDPRLQKAAEAHACEMARRGLMTHAGTTTRGPSGRIKQLGYAPRITSENIAAGRLNLNQTLREWHSSPAHLSNVVIPGLQHHGIGHAVGADGKSLFWAAVYAAPR